MKKMFTAGLMVALAVISTATSSQAGVLQFSGTTTSSSSTFNNKAWSLALTYTANNSGAVAAITAATFKVAGETFSLRTIAAGASSAPTITVNALTGNDTLTVAAEFLPSVPGGFGSTFAAFPSFTVQGTNDIGAAIASDANLQILGGKIGNTVAGQAGIGMPLVFMNLTGSVPAPEPGSIALLSGLGLIVGRRMLKRRAAKQDVVA